MDEQSPDYVVETMIARGYLVKCGDGKLKIGKRPPASDAGMLNYWEFICGKITGVLFKEAMERHD